MSKLFFVSMFGLRSLLRKWNGGFLIFALLVFGTETLSAQQPPVYAYFIGTSFNAGNASADGTKTMRLNMNSALGAGDFANELVIVPEAGYQRGSIFLTKPIYSETGFSAMFEIYLGKSTNTYGVTADGWSFTVSKNTNVTGGYGNGLGYTGIPNSFAMLYRSFGGRTLPSTNISVPSLHVGLNGGVSGSKTFAATDYRPGDDKTGIEFTQADVNALADAGADIKNSGSLGNARKFSLYCWVDYNVVEDYLNFYLNIKPVKPASPVLSKGTPGTDDNNPTGIPQSIGNSYYIGFTGGSGDGIQQTNLRQFYVLNSFSPNSLRFNNTGAGLDETLAASLIEDFTPPTAPVITQLTTGMTPELMVFSVSNSEDNGSGVMKYQYRIGNDPDWHNYIDAGGNFVLDGSRAVTTPIDLGGSVPIHARAIDRGGNISAETTATLQYTILPNPSLTSPADGATGVFPESGAQQLVLSFASTINPATVGTVTVMDGSSTVADFAGGAIIANDPRWDGSHGKIELPFAPGAIGYGKTYTVTVSGFVNTSGHGMEPATEMFTFSTVTAEPTPNASIDYTNERLTGLASGAVFKVNGADSTATGGVIALNPAWIGTTIQIVKPGTASTAGSATQPLVIPARPAAPTGLGSDVNPSQITGTTTAMEYAATPNATTWTACIAGSTEGMADGTYYVRYKATADAFRSATTTVEVKATTYTLNLTAPTFDVISFGDAQPDGKALSISSNGNAPATIASVISSSTNFIITGGNTAVTAGGTNTGFTVQPKDGLPVGVYTATITVTYNDAATTSDVVSITVREATPQIVIDYINESLTGFVRGAVYTINGASQTTSTGNLPIDNAQFGTSQIIIKTVNANAALNSLEQTLQIPARPVAPVGVAATDEPFAGEKGKLTGVAEETEYRRTGETWITGVAGGEITGLAPGSYQVRTKAVASVSFHSQSVTLTIAASRIYKVNVSASRPAGTPGGANGKTATQYIVLTFDRPVAGLSSSNVAITDTDPAGITIVTPKDDTTPNTEWHVGLIVHENNEGVELRISNWADAAGDNFVVDNATGPGYIDLSPVTVYAPVKEDTPSASIDYVNERIIGLEAGIDYHIANAWREASDDGFGGGYFDIAPSRMTGEAYDIVKAGTDTSIASDPQSLTIPTRPTLPAGTIDDPESTADKGSITITNAIPSRGYEYRTLADATTWIPAGQVLSGNLEINNLDPGVYYVRVKAVAGSSFASDLKSFRVHAFDEVDFGSVFVGYSVVASKTVEDSYTVAPLPVNVDAGLTINNVVWVTDDESTELTPDEIAALPFTLSGSDTDWEIVPKSDLDWTPGADTYPTAYLAKIKISYDGGDPDSYETVRFWVHPKAEISSVVAASAKDDGAYSGLTDALTVTFARPISLHLSDLTIGGGVVKDHEVSDFIGTDVTGNNLPRTTFKISVAASLASKTGEAITVSVNTGTGSLLNIYHFQYSNGQHTVENNSATVTIPRRIESVKTIGRIPGFSSAIVQFTLAHGTTEQPCYPIETAIMESDPQNVVLRYADSQEEFYPASIIRVDADMIDDQETGKKDGYTFRANIVPTAGGAIEISVPGCGIEDWIAVTGNIIKDAGTFAEKSYFLSGSGRNIRTDLEDAFQIFNALSAQPEPTSPAAYAAPEYVMLLNREFADWEVHKLYVNGVERTAATTITDPATQFTVDGGGNLDFRLDGNLKYSLTDYFRIILPTGWTEANGTYAFQLALKKKNTLPEEYSFALGKITVSDITPTYALSITDGTTSGSGKYPAGANVPLFGRELVTTDDEYHDETEAFVGWTQAALEGEDGYVATLPTGRTGSFTMPAAAATLTANYADRDDAPEAAIDYVAEALILTSGDYKIEDSPVEATENACTINEDWIGEEITVRSIETIIGYPVTSVESMPQRLTLPARPASPDPSGITSTSETFTGFADGKLSGLNSSMEYKLVEETSWTSVSPGVTEITSLAAGDYQVRFRAVTDVSFASENATVTVAASPTAPVWEIELSKTSTHDFGETSFGYSALTPLTVTVNNTGNQSTGALSLALTGADNTRFTLSGTTLNSIATGGNSSFTVVPNTGLSTGTYTATVTVSNADVSQSFGVSFEVNKKTVTIIPDEKNRLPGTPDPELTFSWSPEVIGRDAFTGELSRQAGEEEGSYLIEQNTLDLKTDYQVNYALAFKNDVYLTITSLPAPELLLDLEDATVCVGGSHTFAVAAQGVNLTYEWYCGNDRIQGANTNSYTITDAKPGDYASYYVIVRSSAVSYKTSTYSKKVRLWVVEQLPETLQFVEYPDPAVTGETYHIRLAGYSDVTQYVWSYRVGATLAVAQNDGVTFSPETGGVGKNETWATFGVLSKGDGVLKATLTHPCGTREATQTIHVDYPTGMEKVTANEVAVYPNPTSGVIKVSGTKLNQIIRIMDVAGSLKGSYPAQDAETTIDLSGYAKGTYLVHYGGKAFKVVRK